MITFKEIEVEGIGSYALRTKFKLDRLGLNLIIAKNGSGKTTLFSILCWVLYGSSLKPKSQISTWLHLQPEGYQGSYGSIKFAKATHEYQVIRCQDYTGKVLGEKGKNRILLLIDGVYQEKLRDKKDVQKEIIKILGYSFELFKTSIIFGQRLKRLIEEDGPRKKQIFEEAFESTFINEARANGELEYIKLNDELKPLIDTKYTNEKLVEQLESVIKTNKITQDNFLADKNKKLDSIRAEIIDITNDLKKSQKLIDKIPKLKRSLAKIDVSSEAQKLRNKELNNWENLEFKMSNGIDRNESYMAKARNELKGLLKTKIKCFACGQKLSKQKLIENAKAFTKEKLRIKTQIKNWKGEMDEFKDKKTKALAEIASINEVSKQANSQLNELKILQEELKTAEMSQNLSAYKIDRRDKLNIEFKDTQDKTLNLNTKELREKIITYETANALITKSINKLEKKANLLKWAITDPLSNKGLKAYIFDSMLGIVNNKLKRYEQYIGFGVKLSINLASANKDLLVMINRNGSEVKYEDLSGGQQQLVNVVTAFALHDATTINKPCNLLVLDEVFESLDTDNVEIVAQIIQSKAKGLSVYLITHLQSFTSYSTKKIHLRLNDKGYTELKSAD